MVNLTMYNTLESEVNTKTGETTMKEKSGISATEISSATLRRACKAHHIDAVKIECSPLCTDIKDTTSALFQTSQEFRVATIAPYLLGHGFLSDVYRSPAQ